MRDIGKLALRLFLFAFVAAAALGITNEVTKGPIEQQKIAAKQEALGTVFPGCTFEQIDFSGFDTSDTVLEELFIAKDESGETVGYALTASPQGYGGPIPLTVGVSVEGYITYIYVGALQETAGLGTRVGEPDFMNQFVGVAADPNTIESDVSLISGATISSSAALGAIKQMLEYTSLAIEPHAGDKEALLAAQQAAGSEDSSETGDTAGEAASGSANTYDVTGFAPFKVAVEVDADGKIVSVSVPEHGETAGFGADLIADQSVFDALVGQDIATAQIDVKSGVTLTSNAINDALKQAAEAYASAAAEPEAEDAQDANADAQDAVVYDVTGFAPFKVAIAVDDAGKIVSVSVPEHSETAGFGADLIADQSVFDALVGQDIATAQIDVKSGVTLTSNAINDSLKQAAASLLVVEEVEAESASETEIAPVTEEEQPEEEVTVSESVEGTVYEAIVKGMSKHPLTLDITVDDSGKIVAATCVNQSEDEGYGADILTDEALSVLVGQDIATAKFDVKSGVTVTSNAINNALALIAQNVAAPAAEATAETEPADEAEATTGVYDVKGFAPFKVEITVDADGKIVSVSVPEHTETAGFGADLIADQSVFDALVGQDIATAQIDVKSGVTLTSNAINDALAQAAEEVQ